MLSTRNGGTIFLHLKDHLFFHIIILHFEFQILLKITLALTYKNISHLKCRSNILESLQASKYYILY